MSQAEIDERIRGSKWVLVVEQMQIITIWTMKYCLLLMYNRLTYVICVTFSLRNCDTNDLQDEFATKHCRQVCRRLCHTRTCSYGDSLPWSLVPTL